MSSVNETKYYDKFIWNICAYEKYSKNRMLAKQTSDGVFWKKIHFWLSDLIGPFHSFDRKKSANCETNCLTRSLIRKIYLHVWQISIFIHISIRNEVSVTTIEATSFQFFFAIILCTCVCVRVCVQWTDGNLKTKIFMQQWFGIIRSCTLGGVRI